MNQAEKIKATLFNDIHEMASHPELFSKSPGKDLYVERLLGIDMPEGEGEFDVTVERLVVRSNSQKGRSHPEKPEIYRFIDKNANFDYVEPGSSDE